MPSGCANWPIWRRPRACPPSRPATCSITCRSGAILQDVVTCIREGCTIEQAGFRRERTIDRCLKSPEEMARLFARHPEAVARTLEIVARCSFSLADLRYQYPDEVADPALTPQQTLEKLVREDVPQPLSGGAAGGCRATAAA